MKIETRKRMSQEIGELLAKITIWLFFIISILIMGALDFSVINF